MKKLFSVFFATLFFCVNIQAQTVWSTPNPINSSNYIHSPLYGTFFVSPQTGWVVGANGTILKTIDGGASWFPQQSGTTNTLNDVYFANDSVGYIVGELGTIIVTYNGGVKWNKYTSSSTTEGLGALVAIPTSQNGIVTWIIGKNGSILKNSTDFRGNYYNLAPSGFRPNSVCFISENEGWIGSNYETVVHTVDGGVTWTYPQIVSPTQDTKILDVYFASSTKGWAITNDGRIQTSNDGGFTWTTQYDIGYITFSTNKANLTFVSPTQGWTILGSSILSTTNGGATWTVQIPDSSLYFTAIHFVSSTHGWVVDIGGAVLHTTDGGLTWTSQISGYQKYFNKVQFLSDTFGWALSFAGYLISTHDGGTNWSVHNLGVKNLNSFHFVSPSQGWIVGLGGKILSTTDGGQNWIAQNSGTTQNLISVFFISPTQGWACGESGVLLTTSNGGITWTSQSSGATNNLLSVFFVSPTKGWVVGGNLSGNIFGTNDGGITWTPQMTGGSFSLASIQFISPTEGWAVGSGGIIVYTNNGGATWTFNQHANTIKHLNSVHFISSSTGWIVGYNGLVLSTIDGGLNWTENTITSSMLSSVFFRTPYLGWAVGYDGAIYINKCSTPQPIGATFQNFCSAANVNNLAVTGQNKLWYTTDTSSTPINTNTPLVNGNAYYASQTVGGCVSMNRLKVDVKLSQPSDTTIIDTACQVYHFAGQFLYVSGTYSDILKNIDGCDSTITLQLHIKKGIGGHVTTSNNLPLKSSKVLLIYNDTAANTIAKIDSTITDSTGYYHFNTTKNHLYVKAIPNYALYNYQIPSYFQNSSIFQNADSVRICNNSDFSVLFGNNPGGSGFIGGVIGNGVGKNTDIGIPIAGLNLILVDSNKHLVASTTTTAIGAFRFYNLPCGKYYIWVDDFTTDNTLAAPIEIMSLSNCSRDDNYKLYNNQLSIVEPVVSSMHSIAYSKPNLELIPNPSTSYFEIRFDEEIESLSIQNVLGETVFQKIGYQQHDKVSTAGLSNGVYFVSVFNSSNQVKATAKLIVAK